jgi:uncharacterized glyoxalase superfamily protein PhnB
VSRDIMIHSKNHADGTSGMRIGTITLGTGDQQRAIEFYTRLLGCAADYDSSGVARFKLQGSWLALYPRDELARYCGVKDADSGAAGFRAVTMSVNVASSAQVDEIVERATLAGARIVQAPCEVSWGGYVAWIADPEEHLWEFVFNPRRAATNQAPAVQDPTRREPLR